MNILDMLNDDSGNAAVSQLAAQFGLPPEQARAAMTALLPHVAAGFQREGATPDGESGLSAALGNGSHESYLDSPKMLASPDTVTDGNAILGHIFGSKDVSRQVATGASQKTGIDPAILKKMLPVVAAIVMGMLARRSKNAGNAPAAPGANPGLGGLLGGLLDRNRDGSIIDDLGGMLGGRRTGTA